MAITIPKKLEEWSIDTINELIKYKDIESETFDFKGVELNQLYLHICAMANTSGGFIVLGIDEVEDQTTHNLVGFKKVGFNQGQEDRIVQQIGNNVVMIDPIPTVNHEILPDNDSKFYIVLQIEHEISKKPFFIKEKGQCYVRIKNSSRPANRTTVLNLFTNLIERRGAVERLRAATIGLKEALLHTSDSIPRDPYSGKITPVDLTFIRNAAISCEWFLAENNLLGRHTERGSIEIGLYYMLYKLDTLNTYIASFNEASLDTHKEQLLRFFESWRVGYASIESVTAFLNNIIEKADAFLVRYH